MTGSRALRRTAVLGCIGLAVIVAPLVYLVALALTSPYSSVRIPASCTDAASEMPASLAVGVPGVGAGTLLARDDTASVVVVGDEGRVPRGGSVYIIGAKSGRVLRHLRLASEAVVASISDGMVFIFDDKIGYIFSASTGQPSQRILESDNYRGLFTVAGTRYLQTSALIAALGLNGRVFFQRNLDFGGIAYGCVVSPPAG